MPVNSYALACLTTMMSLPEDSKVLAIVGSTDQLYINAEQQLGIIQSCVIAIGISVSVQTFSLKL